MAESKANIAQIVKLVEPYCTKIRRGKHMIFYPKGSKRMVVMAISPSDTNFIKNLYQDFRRAGHIIPELKRIIE